MRVTAVLPFTHRRIADGLVSSMAPELRAATVMVDNTVSNIGVMASHNLGVDRMRADDSDWLIVMSAAIRFGAPGGMDFVAALDGGHGCHVVEAAGVFGWHLIAFDRESIERAGKWDENFTPYGFDDIDMALRLQRVHGIECQGYWWTKVPVDVSDTGMAHSIHVSGVRSDNDRLIAYFTEKWGRHPGASDVLAYMRPFNDPDNDIGFWPEAENGGRWDT